MPGRGPEDIQRGHQRFWSLKGGPPKLKFKKEGSWKITAIFLQKHYNQIIKTISSKIAAFSKTTNATSAKSDDYDDSLSE